MPDAIELVIVTPEKQLLRDRVVEVQMPGENGYLGVLPGHAPLITELGIGELSYHDLGGRESAHLAIVRGFAEVLPDRVTVLAETAERAEEIDLQRAKDALARAEKRLASNDPNIDWDRANIALQRALTKSFLRARGINFREVNIEEDPSGEAIVIKANNGKRKVPTLEVGGRYFACSPFDAEQLAEELNIPPNP